MRLWSILRAIANCGHEITFVSFSEPAKPVGPNRNCGPFASIVSIFPLKLTRMSDQGAYLNRLLAMFSPSPFLLSRFRSREIRRCWKTSCATKTSTRLYANNVPAAVNLPPTSLPVAVNSYDVVHRLLTRYVETEPNLAKKLYARLESVRHPSRLNG